MSEKIFAFLLRLYPAHFRRAYGDEALQLFRDTGDRSGQARALNNLGCIHLHHGRYQAAIDHLQKAHDLSNDVGDRASALVSSSSSRWCC